MQDPRQVASPGWILRLAHADARALAWLASRRGPSLIAAMRAITRTGDASVVAAALLAAWLAAPGRGVALLIASTTLGLALFSAAKRVCGRARPTLHALLEAPDSFSMPSGHATCAWAIAVTLSALVPMAAPLAFTWALAVSFSRVLLGVHYPLDVAAGASLGALAALAVRALLG
jgi:undecaprenyl-diphosphatase